MMRRASFLDMPSVLVYRMYFYLSALVGGVLSGFIFCLYLADFIFTSFVLTAQFL